MRTERLSSVFQNHVSLVETDVGNNEPRGLIGIMTTIPWGK